MINDILNDAGREIDRYLSTPDVYHPHSPLTMRIAALRREMASIQKMLDSPTPCDHDFVDVGETGNTCGGAYECRLCGADPRDGATEQPKPEQVAAPSGNEYKHVWLFHFPVEIDDKNSFVSQPERVARNIPTHEVDGWQFVCMVNTENGLFRRTKVS